jgi:hypothetical protein
MKASGQITDRQFLETTINGIIRGRLGDVLIPEGIEGYVMPHPELGIPKQKIITTLDLPLDLLEDLMFAMSEWASYYREKAGELHREAKQLEADIDTRSYHIFEETQGSVEKRKMVIKAHPMLQTLRFESRAYDGASSKLGGVAEGLEKYISVLKYSHRSTEKSISITRNVGPHG